MWTKILLFSMLVAHVAAQSRAAPLSAPDIMRRVAENQDREQKERSNYLYEEQIRVATRRANGKLAREETATYLVTPSARGLERKQTSIKGRYWKKDRYLDFTGDPIPEPGSLDAGLVKGFREPSNDEKSKDGFEKNMFPLTSDEQKDYQFDLAGEQVIAGRKAFCVKFRPNDKNEFTWTGEALMDEEEFQPVSVYTQLSRRIPFAVRALLGTDVRESHYYGFAGEPEFQAGFS